MLKIKELRQEIGLSQAELAKIVNTTQKNISNWENGLNEPDFSALIQFAKYFGVSVDYLLGVEEILINDDPPLSAVDRKLLKQLRALPQEKKNALIKFLET